MSEVAVGTSTVLVLPGWPEGFCPRHYFGARRCNQWCLPARIELAELQTEYDLFWLDQRTVRSA